MALKTFNIDQMLNDGRTVHLELITDNSGRVISFDTAIPQSDYFACSNPYTTLSRVLKTDPADSVAKVCIQMAAYDSTSPVLVPLTRGTKYGNKTYRLRVWSDYDDSTKVYSGLILTFDTDQCFISDYGTASAQVNFIQPAWNVADKTNLLPAGASPYVAPGTSDQYYMQIEEVNDTTKTGTATGGGADYLDDSTEADFQKLIEPGEVVVTTSPNRICTVASRTATRLTFNESGTNITSSTGYTLMLDARKSFWYNGNNKGYCWAQWVLTFSSHGYVDYTGVGIVYENYQWQATSLIYSLNDEADRYIMHEGSGSSGTNKILIPGTNIYSLAYTETYYFVSGYDATGGCIKFSMDVRDWYFSDGTNWTTKTNHYQIDNKYFNVSEKWNGVTRTSSGSYYRSYWYFWNLDSI